jgi:hypothetical protein
MKLRSEFQWGLRKAAFFFTSLLVAGVVYAQTVEKQVSKLRPFSADQTRTMNNKTTTGKIYFTPNAARIESVDGKGNPSIQIMRFDQKVMWNLIPAQRMYVEMPGASLSDWAAWADEQGVQRESLGMEQVGEYHCEKFRVHMKVMGKEATSFEWDAKELDGLPVKTRDEKGTWSTEYKNVKLGPQDPSLFEIPAGYQKMSLGGFKLPRP